MKKITDKEASILGLLMREDLDPEYKWGGTLPRLAIRANEAIDALSAFTDEAWQTCRGVQDSIGGSMFGKIDDVRFALLDVATRHYLYLDTDNVPIQWVLDSADLPLDAISGTFYFYGNKGAARQAALRWLRASGGRAVLCSPAHPLCGMIPIYGAPCGFTVTGDEARRDADTT